MRDELRLFEQTVPDVGTVPSLSIFVRTPGCPFFALRWGDMSYEILNLINLYWVGFYYARWGKLHLGILPNHLESDLSYVQSKYQSIHGYLYSIHQYYIITDGKKSETITRQQ